MNKRIYKKKYIKNMSKSSDYSDETFARQLYKVHSLRKQLNQITKDLNKLREEKNGLY